ncbi:MAG: sigma-70 family RNA polymerase sigma factor [Limibacillus sp.]
MTKGPIWSENEIQELVTGGKGLWDRFVRDHAPLIYAAVQRKLVPAGRSQDREDVAQDVFIRLIKNDFKLLRSFDASRAKLSTWLTIVASSTAIDHLRRNARPTTDIDALPEGLLSEPGKEYTWINIPRACCPSARRWSWNCSIRKTWRWPKRRNSWRSIRRRSAPCTTRR